MSVSVTLTLLASALSNAEDTDIFFITPSATSLTGPLVLIMLDTGALMTQGDRATIADALTPILDQLSRYNGKVGLLTSSHGAKVAIPAVDLNLNATAANPTAQNAFKNPTANNFNQQLNNYEAEQYSTTNPITANKISGNKISTISAHYYTAQGVTSFVPNNFNYSCPSTTPTGEDAYLLPYPNPTSALVPYYVFNLADTGRGTSSLTSTITFPPAASGLPTGLPSSVTVRVGQYNSNLTIQRRGDIVLTAQTDFRNNTTIGANWDVFSNSGPNPLTYGSFPYLLQPYTIVFVKKVPGYLDTTIPTVNNSYITANNPGSFIPTTSQVGYWLIPFICSTSEQVTGTSPELFYRFTNLPLNRAATVANSNLEISLGCLGINTVKDNDDVTNPVVNSGSLSALQKIYAGSVDNIYCSQDLSTSTPSSRGTNYPSVFTTVQSSSAIRRAPIVTRLPIYNYNFQVTIEYIDDSLPFSASKPNSRSTFNGASLVICASRPTGIPAATTNLGSGVCDAYYTYNHNSSVISLPIGQLLQSLINRSSYCGAYDKGITVRVRPELSSSNYYYSASTNANTAGLPSFKSGDPNSSTNFDSVNSTQQPIDRFQFSNTSSIGPSFRPIMYMRPMLTSKASLSVSLSQLYPASGVNNGCLERKTVLYANGTKSWSWGQVNPNWVNKVTVPSSRYKNRNFYQPGYISCEAQPSAQTSDSVENNTRNYSFDMYVGKRGAMVLNFDQVPLDSTSNITRAFLTLSTPIISRYTTDTSASQITKVNGVTVPAGSFNPSANTSPYDYEYTTTRNYSSTQVSSLDIYLNSPKNKNAKIDSEWLYPNGLTQASSFNYPIEGDSSPAMVYKFENNSGVGYTPTSKEIAEICGAKHLSPSGSVGTVTNWSLGTWSYQYSKLPGNTPISTNPNDFNATLPATYVQYDSPNLANQITALTSMTATSGGSTIRWQPGSTLSFTLQNSTGITNDSDYNRYKCNPNCSSSPPRLIGFGAAGDSPTFGTLPQPRLTIYYRCVISAVESCQTVKEYIPNFIRSEVKPFGKWSLQAQFQELIRYIKGDSVFYGLRRGAHIASPNDTTYANRLRINNQSDSVTEGVIQTNDTISNPNAIQSPVLVAGLPSACSAWNISDPSCFSSTAIQRYSGAPIRYRSPFDTFTFSDCDKFYILVIGNANDWPELSLKVTSNIRAISGGSVSANNPYVLAFCDPYLATNSGYFASNTGAQPSATLPLSEVEKAKSCLNPSVAQTTNPSDTFLNYIASSGVSSSGTCISPISVFAPIGINPVYYTTTVDLSSNANFSGTIPPTWDTTGTGTFQSLATVLGTTSAIANHIASSNARAYEHTANCIYEMVSWLANKTKSVTATGGGSIKPFIVNSFLLGSVPVAGLTQTSIWEPNAINASATRPSFLTSGGASNAVINGISRISSGTVRLNASSYDLSGWLNDSLISILTSGTSFASPAVTIDQFRSDRASGFIYFSLYIPSQRHYWEGNLKKYRLCLSSDTDTACSGKAGYIVGSDGKIFVDDNGSTGLLLNSYWSSADSTDVLKGGARQQLYNQMNFNTTSNTSFNFYRPSVGSPIATGVDITIDARRVLFSSIFPHQDITYPFPNTASYYPTSSVAPHDNLVDWSNLKSSVSIKRYGQRQFNIINQDTIPWLTSFAQSENNQSKYYGSYNCWYLRSFVQYSNPTSPLPNCRLRSLNENSLVYYTQDGTSGISSVLSWLYGVNEGGGSLPLTTNSVRYNFPSAVHVTPRVLSFNGESPNDVVKILIGTNDGQIRLINDDTGREEWAYQLVDIFPKVYKLFNPNDPNTLNYDYSTEYRTVGMDGEISIKRISCLTSYATGDLDNPSTSSANCSQADRSIQRSNGEVVSLDGYNTYFGLRRGGVGLYSLSLNLINNLNFGNKDKLIIGENSSHNNHVIPSLNYRITANNIINPPAPPNISSPLTALPQCSASYTDSGSDFTNCYPNYPTQSALPATWVLDNRIGQIWFEPSTVLVRDSLSTSSTSVYVGIGDSDKKTNYNFLNTPNNYRDVVVFGGGFHDTFDSTDYVALTPAAVPVNYGNAIYFVNAFGKEQASEIAEKLRNGGSRVTSIYESSDNPIVLRVSNDGANISGTNVSGAVVGDYADMLYPIVAPVVATKNTTSNCPATAINCIDRVYAVDIVGNVWRVDVLDLGASSSPRVIVKKIASLSTLGNNTTRRFFFNRPEVVQVRDYNFGAFRASFDLILITSGNREKLTTSDLKQDGAFAIIENFALNGMSSNSAAANYYNNHPSVKTVSDLTNLSNTTLTSAQILTMVYNPSTGTGGWYFNFDNANSERATSGGFVLYGIWNFPSFTRAGTNFVSSGNTCAVSNGSGFTYHIDVLTALPLDDLNNDGIVDISDRKLYRGGTIPNLSIAQLGNQTRLIAQAGGAIAPNNQKLQKVIDDRSITNGLIKSYWYEE
ncbi:MAG: hypothetical protein QM538_05160 [Methylacidiphilales bacterium]|nr:hypothetical protein [Candidatus Methylacidiphilales bacterium]